MSANGIDIVLANSCGDAFTFQIQDGQVVYVGEGDLHDQQFDDLMLAMDISSVLMDNTRRNDMISSNGIELNNEYCPSSIHVFPSSSMRQRYYSNNPILFTILIVVVFLFTAIVFQTYDRMVERRQKKVADNAKLTHQIVSSLFPAVVRNRLFGQNTSPEKSSEKADDSGDRDGDDVEKRGKVETTAPKQFNPFNAEKPEEVNSGSNPIADKYHHTTVMFAGNFPFVAIASVAFVNIIIINSFSLSIHSNISMKMPSDIAGFTQWSSTREPSEVFTLLETIYAAFDKLADRRRVFKVRVSGSIYLVNHLVLPNPHQC